MLITPCCMGLAGDREWRGTKEKEHWKTHEGIRLLHWGIARAGKEGENQDRLLVGSGL